MEEHWDLLVDRVGAEEAVALAGDEILLHVLVGQALLGQRDADALPERAHPEVQQHQALLARHCSWLVWISFDVCLCVCVVCAVWVLRHKCNG